MRKTSNHPDQLALTFGKDSEIERIIEARVAIRAEADAIRWRLRLIIIETGILSAMLLFAGWLIGQPIVETCQNALLAAAGCLATGLILVGFASAVSIMVSRIRLWRVRRVALMHRERRP